MSQIYLDITRLIKGMLLGKRPTGVDRVSLAYVRHYGSCAIAVLSMKGLCVTLSEKASAHIFELLLDHDRSPRTSDWRILARTLLGARHRAPRAGILIHTAHSGVEFDRYFRFLSAQQVRVVFMAHDLIPLTHSEYCRAGVSETHSQRMRLALSHAAGIVANSQATLDSLVEYAKVNDLRLPSAVVARLASGAQKGAKMACPLGEPYFVMIGTIEPRKNHWFILHVWRYLVDQLGSAAPKLVVIGRRGWKYEPVVDMLERCTNLNGIVVYEPDCSDDRLNAWLQHARALVFPSFAEGYGMPLVEALVRGVPVLASDLPVFREIAGDIPEYLGPLDGPAWLDRIQAYARHSGSERECQLARIRTFREPTWADHFVCVDRFLEALDQ